MNADDPWGLLRRARLTARSQSDEMMLAALTNDLSRLEEPALAAFDAWFRREADALDIDPIRDVAYQLWAFSAESWFSFRAWCVSRGADFVAQLRANPSVLRRVAEKSGGPFDAPSGELFLYCADYARVAQGRPGAAAAPLRR